MSLYVCLEIAKYQDLLILEFCQQFLQVGHIVRSAGIKYETRADNIDVFLFKLYGVLRYDVFQLSNTNVPMEGFVNIASIVSANQEEEVWIESLFCSILTQTYNIIEVCRGSQLHLITSRKHTSKLSFSAHHMIICLRCAF